MKEPDELHQKLNTYNFLITKGTYKISGLAPWLRIFNTISQPSSGVENASEEIKDGQRIRVNGA
ncbi:hypothetical protein LWH95_09005 [Bacillus sp. G16]|nr:hypothetical protein [Bacillus sp. G16]MCE0739930.1 hypothetical protein [Bacillus sp. G16]